MFLNCSTWFELLDLSYWSRTYEKIPPLTIPSFVISVQSKWTSVLRIHFVAKSRFLLSFSVWPSINIIYHDHISTRSRWLCYYSWQWSFMISWWILSTVQLSFKLFLMNCDFKYILLMSMLDLARKTEEKYKTNIFFYRFQHKVTDFAFKSILAVVCQKREQLWHQLLWNLNLSFFIAFRNCLQPLIL